jgi:hypothetical protein
LNKSFHIGIIFLAFVAMATARRPAAQEPTALVPPDGTVNLGAPPGEKGVWELTYIENMADYVVSGRHRNAGRNGINKRGSSAEPQVPFQAWSAALYDYNVANEAKYDPESYCLPPGGPRLFTAPYPTQIIQRPEEKRVLILFEISHTWREVFLDGREHPATKEGTWLGHSVGRYEDGGTTLVIDVSNFNDGTWLDFAGHPHTNLLHVVEKFSRPSRNLIHYEALIDDPGAYTRPWTVAWNIRWWPDGQLDQYVCEENNKYIQTLKDDLGKPVRKVK